MKDKETRIGFRGGKQPLVYVEESIDEAMRRAAKEYLKEIDEEWADLAFRQFVHELEQIPPFKRVLLAMCGDNVSDFSKEMFNQSIERAITQTRAALRYIADTITKEDEP